MGYDNTQSKPGPSHIHARNSKSGGGSDGTRADGLPAERGVKRITSTHYPEVNAPLGQKNPGGQRNPEGNTKRGFILNEGARGTSDVKDATVAPDGTNRVKKV